MFSQLLRAWIYSNIINSPNIVPAFMSIWWNPYPQNACTQGCPLYGPGGTMRLTTRTRLIQPANFFLLLMDFPSAKFWIAWHLNINMVSIPIRKFVTCHFLQSELGSSGHSPVRYAPLYGGVPLGYYLHLSHGLTDWNLSRVQTPCTAARNPGCVTRSLGLV